MFGQHCSVAYNSSFIMRISLRGASDAPSLLSNFTVSHRVWQEHWCFRSVSLGHNRLCSVPHSLSLASGDGCISSQTHSIASTVVTNTPLAPAAINPSATAVASARDSLALHTPSTHAMPAPTADLTPFALSSNATVRVPLSPTSSSCARARACSVVHSFKKLCASVQS